MTEPGLPAVTTDTSGGVVVSAAQPARRSILGTAWSALCAAIGTVMGLLPHVLHHVTLIAGAALVTGLRGNLVFAALGLLFSVPLLRRLYRRVGTWKAPAIAVAVFALMFSVSAFVIGPALTGTGAQQPAPGSTPEQTDHSAHHGG